MSNPTLRRVAPAEAARLASLARDLFVEAYAGCSTRANVDAYLQSAFNAPRQHAELADPDAATWVVEQGDAWDGFLQVRCRALRPDGVDLARPAHLHRIYVAQAAQGRGLGAQLLDVARRHARAHGADGMWLSVWQQAPGPIGFYRQHGFEVAGSAVFRVGDDDLFDWIMQRRFGASESPQSA